MGIVYPRVMPTSMATQGFRIQRNDFSAPENSGAIGGVQAGWPRWQAQWTVGTTKQTASEEIEAWLDSLRGSQKHFLGRDLRRPYPLAHIGGFRRMLTTGGDPFAGTCTGWSQTVDGEGSALLTLEGLPSGLVLSRIDYIGFKWDADGSAAGSWDRRALARVSEGGIAASDGTVTVTVEPAVADFVPATAVAHLDDPACLMKLTSETQVADVDRRLRIRGTKISGLQVLKP